jgi:hypothetical protein
LQHGSPLMSAELRMTSTCESSRRALHHLHRPVLPELCRALRRV